MVYLCCAAAWAAAWNGVCGSGNIGAHALVLTRMSNVTFPRCFHQLFSAATNASEARLTLQLAPRCIITMLRLTLLVVLVSQLYAFQLVRGSESVSACASAYELVSSVPFVRPFEKPVTGSRQAAARKKKKGLSFCSEPNDRFSKPGDGFLPVWVSETHRQLFEPRDRFSNPATAASRAPLTGYSKGQTNGTEEGR
jgi:hypothetical protein